MQLKPNAPQFAPRPGETKFTPEEWQQTLKDSSWAYPQERTSSPTKAGSAASRKGSTSSIGSRTRQGSKASAASRASRPAALAEGDIEDAGSATGYDREENATSKNGDAMDIDEEPQVNGNVQEETEWVRNVSQQPQRADWREQASTGPTSPASASSTSATDPMNLNGLDKVAPFGMDPGTPGDGLRNLNDLGTGLPVSSAPSSSHPLKPTTPRNFELPLMPKAPDPPTGRLTVSTWNNYVTGFAKYMRAWFEVQKQMQSHFEVRRKELNNMMINATSKPGGMDGWLGRAGERKDEIGLATYLRTLQEDERVREHWNVVCDAHREAVEAFSGVKDRILQNGLADG